MLQLYDKNHNKVAGLTKCKDLCIESVLSTGDKTLSFSYPKNLADIIEHEGYVRTKTAEFVVKEIDKKGTFIDVKCNLNLEDLEGQPWDRFDSTEQTITDCLNLALAGTGWTIGTCTVTKKRTVRKTACNSLDIIEEAKKTYICEVEFDTINKKLNIAETLGSDKGVYFTEQLNLKELETQGNSYDFYTKIDAYGKDDLTVTIENHQYSNKIKTLYWKDERYTDIDSLTEDATYKLNELSKPYIAYAATVLDLANASDKYKDILAYSLGDTISLVSKSNNVKEKQRIVKITEYPDEPTKNSCELGNKTLRFEDVQKQQQDTSDTVNNITSDDGTISESAIKTAVEHLTIGKADVMSLNVVTERVGTLEATSATITQLNVVSENVANLQANKANVTDLTAGNITFGTAEGNTMSLQTLLSKQVFSELASVGQITAGSSIIASEAIGSSQISALDAVKITSGTVDTTRVTIAGANSRLLITGNRLQVFATKADNSLYERVSLGDVNGDGTVYGFRVRGSDGTTVLLDETGVKREGITDGSINNAKIGSDANISGTKLDINSVVTSINNGTTTIQGSKVLLNDKTLDVAFSNLNTTVTNQGQSISNNTASITANTSAISAKLDTQTFTNYKNTNDSNITSINSTLSTQGSSITVLQNQISTKVSQTDINTSINNIQIGSRNYILNSNVTKTIVSPATNYNMYQYNTAVPDVDTLTNTIKYYTLSFTFVQNSSKSHPFSSIVVGQVNGGDEWSYRLWYDSSKVKGYNSTKNIYTVTFSIDGTANQIIHNYLLFLCESSDSAGCTIYNIKLEVGTKATDVTQLAPEDTQGQIDATNGNVSTLTTRITNAESSITQNTNSIALKVATSDFTTYQTSVSNNFSTTNNNVTTAQNTANTAVTNASNAQTAANTANSSIADMANDNLLTPVEKSLLKKDFDAIVAEKPNIDAQATTYNITTELTNYDTSYTTLYNYTNPLFTSMTTNSSITGTTLRSYFSDYYNKKVLLLKKISDLANSSINTINNTTIPNTLTSANNAAQSYANTAQSSAISTASSDATQKANSAQSNAISLATNANKWLCKRYAISGKSTSTIDYTVIQGYNPVQTTLVNDTALNNASTGTTIWGADYSDYVGYAVTNVYVTAATTLPATLFTDDNGCIYLNGIRIAGTTTCVTTSITLNLSAGWNKIEVMWAEGSSGDGFYFPSGRLSQHSSISGMQCTVDNVSDGRVSAAESNIGGLTTRVSTAELKITDDAFKFQIQKNLNNVYKVRYIRDWIQGSNINTSNTWRSIEAINNVGTNVALNKTVTSNNTITNGSYAVDGSYSTSATGVAGALQYVQVDLGQIYDNINAIKISHNVSYGSTLYYFNNTKTEVSADGTNWYPLFNNTVGYLESDYPYVMILNTNSVSATQVTIDDTGLTVKNGAIKVQNLAGTNVLVGDASGNLTINGTFQQYNNAVKSVEIKNNMYKLYDWIFNGDFIGGMCATNDGVHSYAHISVFGDSGNPLTLGMSKTANNDTSVSINEYITLSDNQDYYTPISFYKDTGFYNYAKIRFAGNDGATGNTLGILEADTSNNLVIAANCNTLNNEVHIGHHDFNTGSIRTMLNVNILGCTIYGNLQVNGSKNRIVKTDHYDTRALNSYETTDCLFGDIGNSTVKDGICRIDLDIVFLETVSTDKGYNVFLTKYAQGDIWVDEMQPGYFVVKGDNIPFAWEVKAKQKGYENNRLELISA